MQEKAQSLCVQENENNSIGRELYLLQLGVHFKRQHVHSLNLV